MLITILILISISSSVSNCWVCSGWSLLAVSMIAAVALSYLSPLLDQLQRQISGMFAGELRSYAATAAGCGSWAKSGSMTSLWCLSGRVDHGLG